MPITDGIPITGRSIAGVTQAANGGIAIVVQENHGLPYDLIPVYITHDEALAIAVKLVQGVQGNILRPLARTRG